MSTPLRTVVVLAALALAPACSSTRPSVDDEWSTTGPATRVPRPPLTVADVEERARLAPSAARCEDDARTAFASGGPDLGWAALEACVARADFHHLRLLLAAPWVDELRRRPSAGLVLGRVLARRGGAVDGDLALLHRQRLAVFALDEALANPEVYDGRLVVFRAVVDEIVPAERGATAILRETRVVGERLRERGPEGHTTFVRRIPGRLRPADAARTRVVTEERIESEDLGPRTMNVDEETGRVVFAALPAADPFLAAPVPFLFLARFAADDVIVDGDGAPDPEARHGLVELVAYFETHAWGFE